MGSTSVFLFYKDWAAGKNLKDSALHIQKECHQFMGNDKGQGKNKRYDEVLLHFRSDLLAQLYRECGGNQKQRYTGLATFIDMSWGFPRNLLIVLKHVYAWAVFNGERPFEDKPISLKSQEAGVTEAADWFYRDAKKIGAEGAGVQACIARLGTLFRGIRFSDKPAECSCPAFSADLTRASDTAQRLIDTATKWSLLIDVGGQPDRNTERVDPKYQLNRMLAPRWDLAIYRRGVLGLNAEEVTVIFDPDRKDDFEKVLNRRIERMTAPLFGKNEGTRCKPKVHEQNLLPGMPND
jgi:hypothetical protein